MWDSVSDSLDDFCRPVSDFWVRLFLAKYISIEAKTYVFHTETIGLLLHHSVLQKETTTSALFQCFCTASPTRTHTHTERRGGKWQPPWLGIGQWVFLLVGQPPRRGGLLPVFRGHGDPLRSVSGGLGSGWPHLPLCPLPQEEPAHQLPTPCKTCEHTTVPTYIITF